MTILPVIVRLPSLKVTLPEISWKSKIYIIRKCIDIIIWWKIFDKSKLNIECEEGQIALKFSLKIKTQIKCEMTEINNMTNGKWDTYVLKLKLEWYIFT